MVNTGRWSRPEGFDDDFTGRLVMLEKKRAEVFGETTAVVTTTGPPKSTFLEVFMLNNLVFRWPKPLFFTVLGAHGIMTILDSSYSYRDRSREQLGVKNWYLYNKYQYIPPFMASLNKSFPYTLEVKGC